MASVKRPLVNRLARRFRRQGDIFEDESQPQRVAYWAADELERQLTEDQP